MVQEMIKTLCRTCTLHSSVMSQFRSLHRMDRRLDQTQFGLSGDNKCVFCRSGRFKDVQLIESTSPISASFVSFNHVTKDCTEHTSSRENIHFKIGLQKVSYCPCNIQHIITMNQFSSIFVQNAGHNRTRFRHFFRQHYQQFCVFIEVITLLTKIQLSASTSQLLHLSLLLH